MLTEFLELEKRLVCAMKSGVFDEPDLELFRAIIRTGVDFRTAAESLMIPDKMISDLAEFVQIKDVIRHAEAQFRVRAYGKIWEDGGQKFLLERSAKKKVDKDDIYG